MGLIRQGQTVRLTIATDLESIDAARVTIKSGSAVKTVDSPTIDGGEISFDLTQADTLAMSSGRFEMQVKAKSGDDVSVSNVMTGLVLESLDRGEL